MSPRVLLLTGFEPFGGDAFNPSGTLAGQLHGLTLPGNLVIQGLTLPVSGPAAWQKMSRRIQKTQPHWIIAMGVSGRAEISIESTAWNEMDYRIPDNAGLQPRGGSILSRSPARLESGLAGVLKSVASGSGEAKAGPRLPVRSSTDPGRFVCNYLYYRLLHVSFRPGHCAHRRAVFLHLPPTLEMRRSPQDKRFFASLEEVQREVLGLCGCLGADE